MLRLADQQCFRSSPSGQVSCLLPADHAGACAWDQTGAHETPRQRELRRIERGMSPALAASLYRAEASKTGTHIDLTA